MLKFLVINSECFSKYDAFCLHVVDVRDKSVRPIAMEEVRNYGKTFLKMAVGKMHTPYPTHLAKIQKPPKESGIF